MEQAPWDMEDVNRTFATLVHDLHGERVMLLTVNEKLTQTIISQLESATGRYVSYQALLDGLTANDHYSEQEVMVALGSLEESGKVFRGGNGNVHLST